MAGTEHTHFYGILALALLLIVFRGPENSRSGVLGNVARYYIEETSASVDAPPDPALFANINDSVTDGSNGQGGGADSADNAGDIGSLTTGQDNYVQAYDPASTDYLDGFSPDQVVQYTVQPGDTIGAIASNFGVSVNTVIWANNLTNPNALSLGQVLKIPPVTGVIHTVKSGDTVALIAKKYKADAQKILAFNQLRDDEALDVGNELMVPDGELPGPKPVYLAKSVTVGSRIYLPTKDGQCVSFVQAHGFSSMHGNARDWVKYKNTPSPQVGGVVVFGAGHKYGRYGHVALITAVTANSIQVVEQNFYGRRIVDHREVSLSDSAIVGFIR